MNPANKPEIFVGGKLVGFVKNFSGPESTEELLGRAVRRQPRHNWHRLDHRRFYDSHYGVNIYCKRCNDDRSNYFFDPVPISSPISSPIYFIVTLVRHKCMEVGREDRFVFYLPVTVWLGVCEKCGTVYWDRD